MADEEIPDNWIIRLRCLTVRRRQCWWYHGAGQQDRWGAWSAGFQSPCLHFVLGFSPSLLARLRITESEGE